MNIVFSDRVADLKGSAIRESFKALSKPGMISFAGGMPSPDTYPSEEFSKIAGKILMTSPTTALQYGITEGYAPLIEQTKERLSAIDTLKSGDSVIITSGGQQALELTVKSLINEGDGIACENPSFIGAMNAFRSYGAKLYGVPMDDDGMNMEILEKTLEENKNIKIIYTIPTFQNPSGITMSVDKRKKLLEIAKKYNVWVLEDNPYGDLRFAGEPVPTVKSLDNDGIVIYAGSYSKILSPGLRVGFLCGPEDVIEKAVVCKQVADVHTNVLAQMIISEYLKKYDIEKQIRKSAELNGRKCALMIECIEKYFPKTVSHTTPQGGLFLWCDMNNGISTADLYQKALDVNVAIVSGACALPDPTQPTSAFRLNFSMASDENIEIGIKALGEVLHSYGK